MSLQVFIGGMRGSRPALGSGFDEFGGDTTSLLLLGSRGERLVLDAGTGLRTVAEACSVPVRSVPVRAYLHHQEKITPDGPGSSPGQAPPAKAGVTTNEATILFSHYHLDHLLGLTMNPLFYRREWSFKFLGPTFADGGVRDAVTRLLAQPYWPVSWKQMSARFEFAEFPEDGIEVGGLQVRACRVPHPGGCFAYRIDDMGPPNARHRVGDPSACRASVVFATDLEWRQRTPADEAAFMALCRQPKPASLLLIDAHFAEKDQEAFAGWGHSSREDDLAIAAAAGIPQVLLGHHDPEANDETLRAAEQRVKQLAPGAALARAGQWWTIGE